MAGPLILFGLPLDHCIVPPFAVSQDSLPGLLQQPIYQLVIRLPRMRIVRYPPSRQQLIVPVLLLQPRVRSPYVVFLERGYVLSRTVVVAAFPFCQLLLHHHFHALFFLRLCQVCLPFFGN